MADLRSHEVGDEVGGGIDVAVGGGLEGLAQALDGGARELGELVEEQDAVMGERDLSRARGGAAADQRGGGDGVVRGAKRPGVDEAPGEPRAE